MQINREQLFSFFQLNTSTPVCKEAVELAKAYIVSCAEGIERFGEEEPADRLADITATYNALTEHGDLCIDCKRPDREVQQFRTR